MSTGGSIFNAQPRLSSWRAANSLRCAGGSALLSLMYVAMTRQDHADLLTFVARWGADAAQP